MREREREGEDVFYMYKALPKVTDNLVTVHNENAIQTFISTIYGNYPG